MNPLRNDITGRRKPALIAGTALVIMMIAAAFSYGYVHGNLLVPGDAAATLNHVTTSGALFRGEILGWLVILLCDIVVAWACYVFFKPTHLHLSLLGGWLRITYSAILGIAIMQLLFVQLLAGGDAVSSGFTQEQVGAQVLLYFEAFEQIWSVGLIIFGGHLLILGLLALRSGHVPRWVGILLLIASAGYGLVHGAQIFFAEHEGIGSVLEMVFMLPMTAGEAGFALWLLFRGGTGKRPLPSFPATSSPETPSS